MAREDPYIISDLVCRGRSAGFIRLVSVNCLSVEHLGFQVSIQNFKLVSPFLKYSWCGGLGGWILLDNPPWVLSIKGKE